MKRLVLLAALLPCAAVRPAAADAGWFESGDIGLRNDLLLLNDAGVIRLPVNQWPMPRAAVRYALDLEEDDLERLSNILRGDWRAALAREGAAVDVDLSGDACPACGCTLPLQEGACADCGLQLEVG